ncbi:MAG: hypothetical protein L0Y44_01825 [Phycisphaerales bacterium]|nr:hypothetical protein [Phycisphaerales bacterium]MCI0629375.1 hypothetical protein [Phycisphaerales bacterium]
MTERKSATKGRSDAPEATKGSRAVSLGLVVAWLCVATGCSSPARNFATIDAYYRYDFAAAREAVRGDAMLRNDEQTILNSTRLGMAALADGDLHEAEIALGRSFELLSTAGLNKDRTIAAVLDHEGVRIWKGEPFEQALTYHYVATLYALMGDWENMRAAAANSLFRLTDFGRDQNPEKLARRAAQDEQFLDTGYTAVDTNFALGFLMQAIGSDLSGASGSSDQFDAASKINPDLGPLIESLRARDYNTLLIVDYGKGPTKIAYGPDQALAAFAPQERLAGRTPSLIIARGVDRLLAAEPVCDVDQMAVDHRWNNLEDIRRAKSVIGDLLVFGGAIATAHGSHRDSDKTVLAGLGAIAAGLLTKAGAKADTRYCEFMPKSIFLAPLNLDRATDLRLSIEGDPGAAIILDDVAPGSSSSPNAIYLRLHGRGSPNARWLTQRNAIYSNDHTGVRPADYPWILGGNDLSTPTRETLQAYHDNGYLLDMTLDDLQALYDAEGIHIGSGMENQPGVRRNPSFRHVLEGGTGLFTPEPNSIGYKRLMCRPHPTYQPKSDVARNVAASIRVNDRNGSQGASVQSARVKKTGSLRHAQPNDEEMFE